MKTTIFALPLILAPLAALAQDLPEIADADGNGTWSLTELQTVYADLTQDAFTAMDVNADGGVDAEELTKAIADGLVPPVAN
ncbi:EF-hand domain-containing protein [Aliigemmobacter aestuarii]|uniref:EF-hand domain-containing protein n=1 Tax=Aliigemmobacter aestuarii TaxID=1445661 RepID=A0A4V3V0Y0_9RHOB|nr:EF-hand domain-containing protein [Gemmobacter aestuarii]THD85702.1 EF-hand domain-containing protein [Gemmobacter aestuarii]